VSGELTTQVPVVLQALHEQLAARPTLLARGVPVDLGWPTGGPQPRHLWLDGSIEDWSEEWLNTVAAVGPTPKEERFTITANLLWGTAEAEFVPLMLEAFDVAGEVDRQVQEDFTIGGTVDESNITGGEFGEDYATEGGRRILITRRIAVRTDWPRAGE
jgi:hypothetical protein